MIRKAHLDEIVTCSDLIHESGPEMYDYIFNTDSNGFRDYFKKFFELEGNFMSWDTIYLYEDVDIKGLLLGFPSKEMKERSTKKMMRISFSILRIAGLRNFMRIIRRMDLNACFPDLKDDEFFISKLHLITCIYLILPFPSNLFVEFLRT